MLFSCTSTICFQLAAVVVALGDANQSKYHGNSDKQYSLGMCCVQLTYTHQISLSLSRYLPTPQSVTRAARPNLYGYLRTNLDFTCD